MSTASASSVRDLLDLELPTPVEDPQEEEQEDSMLRDLELQMEIESTLYMSDDGQEDDFTPMSPLAIRSVIQLPGNEFNSTVWVHTKTGRRAKIILEAQDEQESVGLLEFDDQSQEIRRLDSYATNPQGGMSSTPKIRRVDTLTVPNLGGTRLPSMRSGKNPFFDPQESLVDQASWSSHPTFPSLRAGKNPLFSPTGAVFF